MGRRTSARTGLKNGHPRQDLVAGSACSPNIVPHVSKATGVYLNSMLAVTEANNARLRRGDPADARGHGRRRLRREHLRRPRRRDLHARPRDRDPARDHARLGDPDRAGPRLHGRREDADPLRSLPRRRGVHVRHRRRGDAAPRRSTTTRSASATVTLEIQKAYLDTVRGQSDRWAQWLEHVPQLARHERRLDGAQQKRDRLCRHRAEMTRTTIASALRGSTSATRSSCSRCCARGGSRSGRPGRGSSRCSPTPSDAPYCAAGLVRHGRAAPLHAPRGRRAPATR